MSARNPELTPVLGSQPAPPKGFQLGRLRQIARKLKVQMAEAGIYGEDLEGSAYHVLVDGCWGILRTTSASWLGSKEVAEFFGTHDKHKMPRELVESSLSHLVGTKAVPREKLDFEMDRLAAGFPILAVGNPLLRVDAFPENIAQVVEITEVTQVLVKGALRAKFSLRCILGECFGLTLDKVMPLSDRALNYYAHHLGWSMKKFSGDPRELVKLTLWVLPEPGFSEGWTYSDFRVPASLYSYNKAIISLRTGVCPRSYECLCAKCPVGYDQCPAGTHPGTYERRDCPGGHSGLFNAGDAPTAVCLVCRSKESS